MTSSRDAILARIRDASTGAPPQPVPRAYRRSSALSASELPDLFCERAGDYRAEVYRLPAPDLPTLTATLLAARSATRIGIPTGLPRPWLPPDIDPVSDDGLTPAELDRLDGVLTGCTLAIAETGTLILGHGARAKAAALTLIPDLHPASSTNRRSSTCHPRRQRRSLISLARAGP